MEITDTIDPKVDQLTADHLIGRSLTIRVTDVRLAPGDQPCEIDYEGANGLPYRPGKSMRRLLVHAWGGDAKKYIGRSMTLYRDDDVQFGGLKVGGIRISHLSDISDAMTLALTAKKGSKKAFKVQPLKVATPAAVAPPPKPTVRDLLRDALAAATSRDDVAETRNIPGVAKILRDGPEKQREVLQGMISEALARFADDDAPADDDAERGEYGVAEAAE